MSNRTVIDEAKTIIKAWETIQDYQAGKEIDETTLRTAVVTLRDKLLQFFAEIRIDLYINYLRAYISRESYQNIYKDMINSMEKLDKPIDDIRRTRSYSSNFRY